MKSKATRIAIVIGAVAVALVAGTGIGLAAFHGSESQSDECTDRIVAESEQLDEIAESLDRMSRENPAVDDEIIAVEWNNERDHWIVRSTPGGPGELLRIYDSNGEQIVSRQPHEGRTEIYPIDLEGLDENVTLHLIGESDRQPVHLDSKQIELSPESDETN